MTEMFAGGIRHYAVVYSDGEKEVNVGTVSVDPAEISFKRLLHHISIRVGISSEDLTVYLSSVGSSQKTLLFEKLDLSLVLPRDRSGAHYFHVVKRAAERSVKKAASFVKKKRPVDPLRAAMEALQELRLRTIPAKAPRCMEEESSKRNLFTEPRSLLTNTAISDNAKISEEECNGCAFERSDGARDGRGILKICKVCQRAMLTGIGDGGFHPCAYDKIVIGFRRPPWGSISRPRVKNSGKDLYDDDFPLSLEKLEELVRIELEEMNSGTRRCEIL